MGKVFFRMTVGIYLMNVIIFINFNIPCVQLIFKNQIWKCKSFSVNLNCLFCCHLVVLDKELLGQLAVWKFVKLFNADLHVLHD
jgi:hypothetical protein